MKRPNPARILLLVLLQCTAPPTWADDEPEKVIRDLHYGEVLFYFYQDDYFSAITRLLAAKKLDRFPHHEDESELLLGGLYLSYGQHVQAEQIFHNLLDGNVSDSVRDRTWFYLAKIWYQRSYLEKAQGALSRIEGPLPRTLEPERRLLHAQVLMAQQRFPEAIEWLQAWDAPDDWRAYAQFNLGVALIRHGDIEGGTRILTKFGAEPAKSEERKALRDKANLAIGYAYLQSDQAGLAMAPLQRVRLNGPFSAKALLGVGWADSAAERYENALIPWMELRTRDVLDPAVQESLLAVPYAFSKLDASGQAANHYRTAVEVFQTEMVRLDQSMASIRDGAFVRTLLAKDVNDARGWFWRLKDLPDSPSSRYLIHLLAGHEFQEALKNFRDLVYLRRNVERWESSVQAFYNIVDTANFAYVSRLPFIWEFFDNIDLYGMIADRDVLSARYQNISSTEHILGLSTGDEQELQYELDVIAGKLSRLPYNPEIDEMRDKHRLLNGVLLWRMDEDYRSRLWRTRRELKYLDTELALAQQRYKRVLKARLRMTEKLAELEHRIQGIEPQLAALSGRVALAAAGQEDLLKNLAIDELEGQKERLATYMVQARFALAAIYDRASVQETSP